MTTLRQAIDRTLHDYLRVGAGGSRNQLSASINASATSLTLTHDLRGLQSGSKFSIELEDFHAWSVDNVAKTVEADRGEYGTTAAAHTAGDVVLVNPDYTPFQILQALNAAVSQLVSEGIFQASTTELTIVGGQYGYDLTSSTDVLGMVGASYAHTNEATTLRWEPFEHLSLLQSAPTGSFASGTAVQFDALPPAGAKVRVTYRHELSATLAALDDVVETVTGLEADAVPLLCVAAALELTGGREAERNDLSAANPRRRDEVPPGAWAQAPSRLDRLYRNKLKAERTRLARKYPTKLRTRLPLAGKVH